GADAEDGSALHVEAREPVEAGEAEQQPEERQTDGTHAKRAPETGTEPKTDWPGDINREKGQRNENRAAKCHHRAEATAMQSVQGRAAAGRARATRRSW